MADDKPLTLGDLDPRLRELGSDPVPPGSRLHSDNGALPRMQAAAPMRGERPPGIEPDATAWGGSASRQSAIIRPVH